MKISDMQIKVDEYKELPGREIIINVNGYEIPSDLRCTGSVDEIACQTCGLRFTCFTANRVIIPAKALDFRAGFDSAVRNYMAQYVDLTKLMATDIIDNNE